MKVFVTLLLSYLLGSVPWALVIGKLFFHKDIRKEGSGNLGASNAGRVLGKPVAVVVTLLDAFKATIAMAIANALAPQAILFAGLACCTGHCFPVFAGFHGGKAVATTYGYLLGIALFVSHSFFWNFFFPIICFFVILFFCRTVSVSSLASIGIAVLMSVITKEGMQVTLCLLALWLFVIYRHRSNLQRIANGTENKIKWMGKAPWEKQ